MKKIEDYIHLYLGCDVELDNSGSKVVKKLVAVGGVDDYAYCKLRLGTPEKGIVHATLLREKRVKLILRPLSDMTDVEHRELMKICFEDEFQTLALAPVGCGCPKGFAYLLSKHFDLFGLIEAGLAIDATTLNA